MLSLFQLSSSSLWLENLRSRKLEKQEKSGNKTPIQCMLPMRIPLLSSTAGPCACMMCSSNNFFMAFMAFFAWQKQKIPAAEACSPFGYYDKPKGPQEEK